MICDGHAQTLEGDVSPTEPSTPATYPAPASAPRWSWAARPGSGTPATPKEPRKAAGPSTAWMSQNLSATSAAPSALSCGGRKARRAPWHPPSTNPDPTTAHRPRRPHRPGPVWCSRAPTADRAAPFGSILDQWAARGVETSLTTGSNCPTSLGPGRPGSGSPYVQPLVTLQRWARTECRIPLCSDPFRDGGGVDVLDLMDCPGWVLAGIRFRGECSVQATLVRAQIPGGHRDKTR